MSFFEEMNGYLDQLEGKHLPSNGTSTALRPSTSSDLMDNFYLRLQELGMNLEEIKPILESQDTTLVLSGAGTGKTTLLVLKIIRDLLNGDMSKVVTYQDGFGQQQHAVVPARILVSTFLNSGIGDIQKSFYEWCQNLGIQGLDASSITFKTIHAEVLDALKSMGVQVNILKESDSLIRTVMQKYGIRSVNATSRNITLDEVKGVSSIVSYARNRLDGEKYSHSLMGEFSMDSILLDAILQDLKVMRASTGGLDFEDIQEMLVEALYTNPNVVDFIRNRYDYIFVDEFQDTSQLQYAIVYNYFQGAKRTIVIGDDDQTIYSWRGSDINIITRKFIEDFNPVIHALGTNYRCGSNILNAVIPSIERNETRLPKQLKAYREGGLVEVYDVMDINNLIEGIKNDLRDYGSVGVLARINNDLLIPTILLELDGGVPFTVSKSVSMNDRMSRQIYGVMDLLTKRYTEDFEAHFRLFLPRYEWKEAERLSSVLVANKSYTLFNIPEKDLTYSLPTIAPYILSLRKSVEVSEKQGYEYLLRLLKQIAFGGNSLYAMRARNLIDFTINLMNTHKDVKDLDIHQLDRLFNIVLPSKVYNRASLSKEEKVKLTTVHEAKGKQWDSVYIWNNITGMFPNLVGNRELTKEEYEEERRVHYIAWTRAKDKLTVYTKRNQEGYFLLECDSSYFGVKSVKPSGVDGVEMTNLYKKEQVYQSIERSTKDIYNEYIEETFSNVSVSDSRVVNIDIVREQYTDEEIIAKIEEGYGFSLDSKTDYFEILDNFFAGTADELYYRR